MSEHRWEARALLEDGMTEGRVGGSALQLVTVCLRDAFGVADELGEPLAPRPPVVSYLRPSEARELAFCLLELAELAELAERRSGTPR